ncbi:MAG: hypothetical protein ACLRXQ_11650 [Phascolarctobacterium faecium]
MAIGTLYRTTREDYKFANAISFSEKTLDSYTLLEAGPMNNTETSVRLNVILMVMALRVK